MLSPMATAVYLELGQKKVFASALDWPGWSRSAKSEEEALEALADYADRYRAVVDEIGVAFRPGSLDVVERVKGNATTDFGAPAMAAKADSEPLTAKQASRMADLVAAAWTVLDRVAAQSPAELIKGPRGGGRDRDKMIAHVLDAEKAYLSKLGIKLKKPSLDEQRAAILDFLRAARAGEPAGEKKWLPRYGARRIAWHALDHAWEMQDRTPA